MTHKQHTHKGLPWLLIVLVVVLARKIVGLLYPEAPLDDGMLTNSNINSPKSDVVQAPGEKIIPEPQPPQVPVAEVGDAQSIPEVPSDIIGVVAKIEGRPTGKWFIDAVSGAQNGQLVVLTGMLITEGDFVLGGAFIWSIDTSEIPCIFTVESYTNNHLIGWLKRGKISRKVSIPMQLTFSERMIAMHANRALPYESWEVLKKAESQSEFIEFSWDFVWVIKS